MNSPTTSGDLLMTLFQWLLNGIGYRYTRRTKGFTLIELLVVLAIIGTLLSIAAPRYSGSVDKANLAVLQQNLSAIRESIDKLHGDTGKYPQTLDELVTKRYVRSIPVDPVTGSNTTWLLEQSTDPNSAGIVDVHSGAAGKTRSGKLLREL